MMLLLLGLRCSFSFVESYNKVVLVSLLFQSLQLPPPNIPTGRCFANFQHKLMVPIFYPVEDVSIEWMLNLVVALLRSSFP
jgi:hypothetical protein